MEIFVVLAILGASLIFLAIALAGLAVRHGKDTGWWPSWKAVQMVLARPT